MNWWKSAGISARFGLQIPVCVLVVTRSSYYLSRTDNLLQHYTLTLLRSEAVDGQLVHVYGEYYHHGFGVRNLDPVRPLPEALQRWLIEGELFVLAPGYRCTRANRVVRRRIGRSSDCACHRWRVDHLGYGASGLPALDVVSVHGPIAGNIHIHSAAAEAVRVRFHSDLILT